MRQAAQAKMGFYPAPAEAISLIIERLQPPEDNKPWTMLDPCAGESAALEQLATGLKCRPQDVYAIELDERRGAATRARLPDSHVLEPCSFFGAGCNKHSFSLIYCNPPFDDEIGGGGRVELSFIRRATDLLVPGGLLVQVCPQKVAEGYACDELLGTHYEYGIRFPFPTEVRRFGESVTICRRRREPIRCYELRLEQFANVPIPPAGAVKRFEKIAPTPAELATLLAKSPLRRHLIVPDDVSVPEPPLALGQGHIALLLASGHLDGLVRQPGEDPHVVRGTARKVEYVDEQQSGDLVNEDGDVVGHKLVKKERMDLLIRTVDGLGAISTLKQQETVANDCQAAG
jgi:hypothetical protein